MTAVATPNELEAVVRDCPCTYCVFLRGFVRHPETAALAATLVKDEATWATYLRMGQARLEAELGAPGGADPVAAEAADPSAPGAAAFFRAMTRCVCPVCRAICAEVDARRGEDLGAAFAPTAPAELERLRAIVGAEGGAG